MFQRLLVLFLLFSQLSGKSQYISSSIKKVEFGAPIDIPMYLAGSFGEIRSNHFHTGLDIKTQGREGFKILAAEKGYVSRIAVSAYGYGNALYVTHPNGYTTVYAHLQAFNPTIQQYTKNVLYQNEKNEMNIFPPAGILKVEKGEIIALSGNSGGSGGPHLHFEIRETATEYPVNPLLFDFDIQDNIKPSIYGLMVYALDDESNVNGARKANYSTGGLHGNYTLRPGQTITAHGNIGIAIHTIDKLNTQHNRCGIFSIKVEVDGKTTYLQKMDKLDFSKKRYMNAHVDYKLFKWNKKHYHKCYLEPHNKLPIYKELENRGVLSFNDEELHPVKIVVTDPKGNSSQFNFTIKGSLVPSSPLPKKGNKVFYNQPFSWNDEFTGIEIPAYNLYNDVYINCKTKGVQNSRVIGKAIQVGSSETPLHSYFSVKFNKDKLPSGIAWSKVYMATMSGNNIVNHDKVKFSEKWVTGKTRVFGTYALAIDNSPPTVSMIGSKYVYNVSNGKTLKFILKDPQTGVEKYDVYLNDKWALASYDGKNRLLKLVIDSDKFGSGEQTLKLVVTNGVGNTQTFTKKIVIL